MGNTYSSARLNPLAHSSLGYFSQSVYQTRAYLTQRDIQRTGPAHFQLLAISLRFAIGLLPASCWALKVRSCSETAAINPPRAVSPRHNYGNGSSGKMIRFSELARGETAEKEETEEKGEEEGRRGEKKRKNAV